MGENENGTGSLTSRRNIVPIFIMEIMKNETGKEHHVTQEYIRTRLQEKYDYKINRKSLGKYINLMLEEDLFLFGSAATGYWYDRDGYRCFAE